MTAIRGTRVSCMATSGSSRVRTAVKPYSVPAASSRTARSTSGLSSSRITKVPGLNSRSPSLNDSCAAWMTRSSFAKRNWASVLSAL